MGKSADGDAGTSAYMQGATEMSRAAQLGALFFAQDTSRANRIINDATVSSNQALQPLTTTATVAIAELRRMMGLTPMDPMLSMGNQINALASHYQSRGDLPTGVRSQLMVLDAAYNKMHDAKTVEERVVGQKELLKKMDKAINTFSGNVPISSEWVAAGRAGASSSTQAGGTEKQIKDAFSGGNAQGGGSGAFYQPGYFDMTVGKLTNVRDQVAQFDMSEESVHPKAQTGEQIAEEFTHSPNFQVAMKAGTQTAERAAAANHNRFSGNQLVSLQQLGQDTASSLYNNQVSQLMSLAGMTTPGITGTANNQFNSGQLQGANMMAQAASGQHAQDMIGTGYQTAYNKVGDARNQASIANAQMSMQGMQMGMGLLGKLF